jgi:DNA topoisomerase-1
MDLFKLPRELGEHEGEKVIVGIGRFGPYIKVGTIYASLQAEDDALSVELPRALELIALKKAANVPIGEYEGQPITKGRGRFGPFVKWGSLYANIPKTEDPAAVTFDRAVELIKAKQAGAAAKTLRTFEGSPIQILEGRYGPYITDGKKNANVPKGKKPDEVTLEECTQLLADAPERKKSARKGGFRRKKS